MSETAELLAAALQLLRYYRTRPHYSHETPDGGIGPTMYVIGVHRLAALEATNLLHHARELGIDPPLKDFPNAL